MEFARRNPVGLISFCHILSQMKLTSITFSASLDISKEDALLANRI